MPIPQVYAVGCCYMYLSNTVRVENPMGAGELGGGKGARAGREGDDSVQARA